jgi:hypothetical protein
MSLSLNFFSSLSKEELAEKIKIILTKHSHIFPSEFGLSEAFDPDEFDHDLLADMGVGFKVSSHFMAWPQRGTLNYSVEDMAEVIKGEFEPDQLAALWEMDEFI